MLFINIMTSKNGVRNFSMWWLDKQEMTGLIHFLFWIYVKSIDMQIEHFLDLK